MKAFLISVAALVVISAVAAVGLGAVDMSSKSVFSAKHGDVRL